MWADDRLPRTNHQIPDNANNAKVEKGRISWLPLLGSCSSAISTLTHFDTVRLRFFALSARATPSQSFNLPRNHLMLHPGRPPEVICQIAHVAKRVADDHRPFMVLIRSGTTGMQNMKWERDLPRAIIFMHGAYPAWHDGDTRQWGR